MNIATIRDLLEQFGYTLTFKEDDWVRCLVSGNNEQWLGKGFDQDTAIQDVLRAMFPSKFSLELLTRLVQPQKEPEGAEPPPIPAVNETAVEAAGAAPVDPALRAKEPESEPDPEPPAKAKAVSAKPKPVVTKEPVTKPVIRHAKPAPEPKPEPQKVVSPVAGPRALHIVEPARVTYEPVPVTYVDPAVRDGKETEEEEEEEKLSKEEALEILTNLGSDIEAETPTVAVMSGLNQRLQLAAWIFQARTIQEQFKTDEQIEKATHKIAVSLTHICKVFWPGSVRALQVYTSPNQGLEGLVRSRKIATRWSEAAEIMAEHIEEMEGRAGYDEYGWKDGALLRPEAPNPDKILNEAIQKIESVVGPLGGHLDEKDRSVPGRTVVAELEELILAAHLLRWVRCSTHEQVKWGQAMGALRWAARQTRQRLPAFSKLLHDDYVPQKPWAQLLGRDPEVNRKNVLKKQVMKAMPQEEWLEEDVMSWLHKAFQVFSNPQIAKLASAVRSEILEFTNADFADADRNTRSRLRKLQAIFRNQTDLSRVNLPSEEELKTEHDEEEEAPRRKPVDPTELIRAEVEKLTADKHILFVTNRDDQRLQKDLEGALKCKVTLKDGGNPRTIKAIVKSVDATKYDFVLMATGFNNASADAALCRATKAEGLPYIRVQKGRLGATIRALGRAFNLTPESQNGTETTAAHEA